MKTKDEINTQIVGLLREKDNLPEYNVFGDNNWAQISAKIEVLQGTKEVDDFLNPELDADDVNEELLAAEQAEDWLAGRITDNLFDDEV